MKSAVRRFALFAMLAALVGTGAAAATPAAPNDGTLIVKNGVGRIVFTGKGAVIGRFDIGKVTIKDPNPNDGTGPIVWGAEAESLISEKTTLYKGNDVRFRIIGGKSVVTVNGSGVQLNVIGVGTITLDGRGTLDDGTFAVNGGPALDLPLVSQTFLLQANPPPGG
jgi:hypothetical protein